MQTRNWLTVLPIISVMFLASNAFASRWIVKNPGLLTAQNENAKVVKVLSFNDGNTYAIVEMEEDNQVLSFMPSYAVASDFMAESASLEPAIGLHAPADEETLAQAAPAWHVSRLKYSELAEEHDGRGVIVAVLDTGVDYTHPALKNKMWVNPGEIAGNGIDDDNNGIVDDIHGASYLAGKVGNDPMDGADHGTHCAGIIAADPQDPAMADSARGVAPGAKIMALKIIGSSTKQFLSDAASAVKYATDNGAKVLSNSWRVYKNWSNYYDEAALDMLKSMLLYAESQGVIFVGAAGNESLDVDAAALSANPIFPINLEGVRIAGVAASQKTDDLPAGFTNYGQTRIQVAAPGAAIISTVRNGAWGSKSGTSMATPLVAGALARGVSRGLDAFAAFDQLQNTAVSTPAWAPKVNKGLVDLVTFLQ